MFIIAASLINQPIPDSDFRAKIDEGMMIEDRRDGKHSVRVMATESSSSEKWDKLLEEKRHAKP